MGGDEFCVLASAARVGPGADLCGRHGAQRPGEGFSINCSYGSVLLPKAHRVSDALRIADGRMYLHKNRHRPTAGRQSMDVLVRVLHERNSEQDDISQVSPTSSRPWVVAFMCRTSSSRHSAGGRLRHRQGVHPGADPLQARMLTDAEWEIVRRHPLVGERILTAAPAARTGRPTRPLDARTLRRHRISRRPEGTRDPAGRPDHRRLRRLRRHDVGALHAQALTSEESAPRAAALRRDAVRRRSGRGVHRSAHARPRRARRVDPASLGGFDGTPRRRGAMVVPRQGPEEPMLSALGRLRTRARARRQPGFVRPS